MAHQAKAPSVAFGKNNGVLYFMKTVIFQCIFLLALAAGKLRGDFVAHVSNDTDPSGIHVYGLTSFLASLYYLIITLPSLYYFSHKYKHWELRHGLSLTGLSV